MPDSNISPVEIIRDNFLRLSDRVNDSMLAAGRDPNEVTIVGVTKYVSPPETLALFQAGCECLGESRPQALEQKARELAQHNIQWHMIGHLQRNKVAKVLPHAALVHSVDSTRLAKAISSRAVEQAISVDVLLEVNISNESAKHGFSIEQLPDELAEINQLVGLRVRGLMGMAGLGLDERETRTQFASLRELKEKVLANTPLQNEFKELSMGMSGDFHLAIAEGATLIRVGSLLFQGLNGSP